ncbi:hypothetical protein HN709_01250 [Candidatus Peregrinibacteria bacterium]|jgi:hypothetical protein|nr:hypothetical protein [Candidatus Peregrinibacteria bacterium]MBT7736290.1 hypothetical protein [Candidatus Peregrinibacteria bacterium]
MGVRSKTLVTVLLVGAVIGVMSFSATNENLFKGQLMGDKDEESTDTAVEDTPTLLPDLTIGLSLTEPETPEGDLVANIEISNTGEGALVSGQEFVYEIEINGEQVLSNSDSYSALEKGDSFSFSYPIPQSIYQYAAKGEVSAKVDTGNVIKEANESNNAANASYDYLIER